MHRGPLLKILRAHQYLAISLPCLKLMRDMQGAEWPKLVIRDVTSWLMVWQGENTRYVCMMCFGKQRLTLSNFAHRFGFEVALSTQSSRFLLSDAAELDDIDSAIIASLGVLSRVAKFKAYLQRAKSLARSETSAINPTLTLIELDGGSRMLCDFAGITAILPHLSVSLKEGTMP